MCTLSIVVPVYNAQAYIKKLAESLNKQTRMDFRAIFVDDASTDRSLQILSEIKNNAAYEMEIIPFLTNSGPGKARNIGMNYVTTPFFTFIDADDFVSTNYVEELLYIAEETNADIVVSSTLKIWDNGRAKTHYDIDLYQQNANDLKKLACILDFGPCGKIYRTDLWDSISTSFPTEIRCEDLAVIPVLYKKSGKIAFAPKAIYYYFQSEISRSNTQGKYYNDIFLAFLNLNNRIDDVTINEFHCAFSIGYGVIMNAILYGVSRKEIMKYVKFLREKFPHGYRNKYLRYIPMPKRCFIVCSYAGVYWILKALVYIGKAPRKVNT